MRALRVLVLLTVGCAAARLWAGEPADQRLSFEITDPRKEVTHAIDGSLMLRVVRVPSERVEHFGWEVQVVERTARRRNLLRDKTYSGGPHPTDILAWLSRDRHFPDDRTLIIPGHPYEIRIRLLDCRTEQIKDTASFVSGRVEISWRRLDLARLATISASPATIR